MTNEQSPWIEWTGGKCPVAPETKVVVVLEGHGDWRAAASQFDWESAGKINSVTAYRVAPHD